MKLLTKEKIALKILFRHTLIVYISVVLGFLLLAQFGEKIIKNSPRVFTDSPGF
jgi:hypothetical protein